MSKRHIIRILIFLFGVVNTVFMMIQAAMVMFITSYCKDYLDLEYVGRYLISCYYCGQLLYRLIRSVLCNRIKEKLQASEFFAFCNLMMAYVFCAICITIWVIFASNLREYAGLLFAVFGLIGFVNSGTIPIMHQLCESITPISGKISCIFTLCLGGGEALIITFIGWAAGKYTIEIQPYPAFILCCLQLFVLSAIIKLYRYYPFE